jgi:hypothetical protein
MTFHEEYCELEHRFQARAEEDGYVYLPNAEPSGPVRYVFVAMEPSRGWASSDDDARAKVKAGFRNFITNRVCGVVLLHHAIREYLGTDSYHLTDFSKGAMGTVNADIDREARYDRWYPLLREELALVGPDAPIFALGRDPETHLQRRGTRSTYVLHYSSRWLRHRDNAARGREREFEAFRNTVSYEDVLTTAQRVLEMVPVELREARRNRPPEGPLS